MVLRPLMLLSRKLVLHPSDPAGPYVAGGPVGPYGTLSPFKSDPAGPDGPYVTGDPVGPFGTLSPSPVLRYWWTLVGYSLFLTLHLGVRYLRVKKD